MLQRTSLVLLLLAIAGSACAAPPPTARHALILGLDGCRPDALLAADAPNFHKLIEQGAFTATAQCVPARPTGADTISGPGWSGILTGVWADKHGCVDNKFVTTHYADYPCLFTRLRAQDPHAYLASVASWSPIAEKIIADADVNLGTEDDERTAAEASRILAEKDPQVLFVHFDGIDHTGHATGFAPDSQPYLDAIHAADARAGRVLEAMRQRKAYAQESWLVIVCADHGGRGKNHGGGVAGGVHDPARTSVPVICAGAGIAHGEFAAPVFNVDILPTLLRHLQVPANPEWKLDGHPLEINPTAAAATNAPAVPSLVANGDFEQDTKSAGWPDGWPHPQGATWEAEDGNHFLRLRTANPGDNVLVYLAVPIKPDQQALELSYRVRFADVKVGKQSYFDGRIMMNFKDAAGKVLSPSPKAPNFRGTSKGWVEHKQQFAVPAGADKLELMFTLFQAASGTLDFDDVKLVAIPLADMPPPPPPPPPKPVVIAPPSTTHAGPASRPAELHVVGNQLQTPDGKPVWLQGLAVPSLEWSGGGDHVLQSIAVGIEQWKANAIRLPVNEEFWFGRNKYQKDGGVAYRKLVDAAVDATASRGAYLILDLHRFRAPTTQHVEFWKDAAVRYANHPAVLFDLLNEPHDLTWEVWRNGGEVTEKAKDPKVIAENAEAVTRFQSVGMQALLDTVRAAGARNIAIVGGLDWGYDLSGVVNGFALTDAPGGNGIMYSSHIYPWKDGWQKKVLVAADKYPIFLGEVGCEREKMSFVPADKQEDPSTWAPDMLGLIQSHRLNWTAWCFHPKSSPRVIADWDYTPTDFWGAYVKAALVDGKQYETKRLR